MSHFLKSKTPGPGTIYNFRDQNITCFRACVSNFNFIWEYCKGQSFRIFLLAADRSGGAPDICRRILLRAGSWPIFPQSAPPLPLGHSRLQNHEHEPCANVLILTPGLSQCKLLRAFSCQFRSINSDIVLTVGHRFSKFNTATFVL